MQPKIYAHRGGAGYYVENTLPAFAFALELGADGAELDVHLTKDGHVVVYHNAKLNHRYTRKENGEWLTEDEEQYINTLTLDELKKYTVGEPNPNTKYHKKFPKLLPTSCEHIPTLEEVIDLVQEKSNTFRLLIEIKTDIFEHTIESYIPLIDRVQKIIKEKAFSNRIEYCSFDWRTLNYIKANNKKAKLWFITHPFDFLVDRGKEVLSLSTTQEHLKKMRTSFASGKAPWYGDYHPSSIENIPEMIKKAGGDIWFMYWKDMNGNIYSDKINIAVWTNNLNNADDFKKINTLNIYAQCIDYPGYHFVKSTELLDVLLKDAYNLRKEKKYNESINIYEKIYNTNTVKTEKFYKDFGVVLRLAKDYDKCEKILNEGLIKFPHLPKLLTEKAVLFRDQKLFTKAMDIYQVALRIMGEKVSDLNINRYTKIISHVESTEFFPLNEKTRIHRVLNHLNILISIKYYRKAFDFCKTNQSEIKSNEYINRLYKEIALLSNQTYVLDDDIDKSIVNTAVIPSGNLLWHNLALELEEKTTCNIVYWLGYPSINVKTFEALKRCEYHYVHSMCFGQTLTYKNLPFIPDPELLLSKEFLTLKNQVLKMMDRQDAAGRYRLIDREAVFYSMFFYFYSMLKEKNIKLVIAGHTPHLPSTFTLYKIAEILNIKTVVFMPNTLVAGFEVRTNLEGNRLKSKSSNSYKKKIFNILKDYVMQCQRGLDKKDEPDYMIRQKQVDKEKGISIHSEHIRLSLSEIITNSLNPNAPYDKKSSWQVRGEDFLYKNSKFIERSYETEKEYIKSIRNFLLNEYNTNLNLDDIPDKFVFFPLQYEPEKTSNPDGGKWYNMYDALVALRNLVPLEIPILIKEHYSQFSSSLSGYKGRSPYFYRSILSLPNIHFLDVNIPSAGLIQNSLFVASITGTACLEAACSNNKSLLFGYPWFYGCPNTFSYDEGVSFDTIVNSKIENVESILNFMRKWVDDYYVYGAYSTSDIKTSRIRHVNEPDVFNNIDLTATEILDTLSQHGLVSK